ncbi:MULTISPECIES: DUF956 family protein [unclassified Granulicatella]|uniref:DUF956 family protein n=1 Tax=unclassified Granulicatella TaxID=2630493 RepID=UPI00107320A1|nr:MULTISPECIES: DUF956 family protein [unclassified Granulicatella]MBF0780191.1 DUF956 family protein [Granulicatella sp. 19428wC4_WM01]TFU95685.1 DUF956 family protein [Granulicatella sp. WM01]
MAKSQNTQVLFVTKANSFHSGLGAKHGNVMIGDKAFEFYNEKNPEDFIQIPWQEIALVRAQVFFRNKYIRGFYIDTKQNGTFNFVVYKAGKSLKMMREFIGNEKIVKQPSIFKRLWKK